MIVYSRHEIQLHHYHFYLSIYLKQQPLEEHHQKMFTHIQISEQLGHAEKITVAWAKEET